MACGEILFRKCAGVVLFGDYLRRNSHAMKIGAAKKANKPNAVSGTGKSKKAIGK